MGGSSAGPCSPRGPRGARGDLGDLAAWRGRDSRPAQGRQRPQWDGGCPQTTARAREPSAYRAGTRPSHPDDSRAGSPLPTTPLPSPAPTTAQGPGHQRRNCVFWGNAQGRKLMRPDPAQWEKGRLSHHPWACLRGKQRHGERGGLQGCPRRSLLPEPGFSLTYKLKFLR